MFHQTLAELIGDTERIDVGGKACDVLLFDAVGSFYLFEITSVKMFLVFNHNLASFLSFVIERCTQYTI